MQFQAAYSVLTLVQDFPLPVATDTIKAILGIGDCDSDIIRRFTSDSVIFLEPINAKAEELVTAERSYDELSRCIASVLERISTPDDALSNIREAIEDGTQVGIAEGRGGVGQYERIW